MKQYRIGFTDGTTRVINAARYVIGENVIYFRNTDSDIVFTISTYNMVYIELA